MNTAYRHGKRARNDGKPKDACPYGVVKSRDDDTPQRRERAALVMRHWWLAGWADKDIEMGFSVIKEKTYD